MATQFIFIPRLPTAAAHKNPFFPNFKTLEDLLFAIKNSALPMRGDILLKPDEVDFIPFSNYYDLKAALDKIKEPSTLVSRIYLYDIGSIWFPKP